MNYNLLKYYKLNLYLYYLYFIKILNNINPYTENKTPSINEKPDIYMAVSCIALSIPGIYGLYMGQISGIFACIMSVFSLNNDYISLFHNKFIVRYSSMLLDEIFIIIYVISTIIVYINNKFYFMCILLLTIFIFISYIVLFNYSCKSISYKEWKSRHIIWHIVIFLFLIFTHQIITKTNTLSFSNYFDYISFICGIIAVLITLYILIIETDIIYKNKKINNDSSII